MKCPNDMTSLQVKSQEGVVALACKQCQAIFLKADDVKVFKHNFDTDYIEKAFKNPKAQLIQKQCANCDSLMHSVDMDSMQVEICKNCTSVLFYQGQLTRIKENYSEISDLEVGLMGCLPPSFLVFFVLFKYFTTNSANKKTYGWLFIIAIFFVILFWSDVSSYHCSD